MHLNLLNQNKFRQGGRCWGEITLQWTEVTTNQNLKKPKLIIGTKRIIIPYYSTKWLHCLSAFSVSSRCCLLFHLFVLKFTQNLQSLYNKANANKAACRTKLMYTITHKYWENYLGLCWKFCVPKNQRQWKAPKSLFG